MADYRIDIIDDEGVKQRPILFADVSDPALFEALRVTAETLDKADNVQRASLAIGGEPEVTVRVIFCRSDEEPEQPTGDNLLEGWDDEVTEGNAPAWTTSAHYKGGTRIGPWAPQQRIS